MPIGTVAIKVFISYARVDAAQLAQRLHGELLEPGFQPWLDTQRLKGGASWASEIEVALDEADVVVALLSDGSYRSEIWRAEQLRSLRKGTCVIPVLAEPRAEVPLYLEARQHLDSASRDGTVRVWDMEAAAEVCVLRGHSDSVRGVAVHPGGRLVVSTSRDRTLKLWDLETTGNLATFTFDAAPQRCAFVSDRVVIAGDNGGGVHFLCLELSESV